MNGDRNPGAELPLVMPIDLTSYHLALAEFAWWSGLLAACTDRQVHAFRANPAVGLPDIRERFSLLRWQIAALRVRTALDLWEGEPDALCVLEDAIADVDDFGDVCALALASGEFRAVLTDLSPATRWAAKRAAADGSPTTLTVDDPAAASTSAPPIVGAAAAAAVRSVEVASELKRAREGSLTHAEWPVDCEWPVAAE